MLKVVPVQVVDYIGVFVFPHNENLVNNELFLWLLLQIHLFNGHLNRVKGREVSKGQEAMWRLSSDRNIIWFTSCPVAMSIAVYTVPDALKTQSGETG